MTTSAEVRLSALIAPVYFPAHRDLARGAHRQYLLSGGRGSGKSSFAAIELLLGLLRDAQRGERTNAAVFRRYKDALQTSVFAQLHWAAEQLGVQDRFHSSVSPLRMVYVPTGQEILFRGADRAEKVKSIRPAEGYLKYLWFEELDEFESAEKVRSIRQSTVRGADAVVFYTFNPPRSLRSWVNDPEQWDRPDVFQLRTTYLDLPPGWLGPQFFADAEHLKQVRPELYAHEYLGRPGGAGSEVFSNLEAAAISDAQIARFDRVYSGVDWGFYPDPWAFNQCAFDAARRTLYLFREATRRRAGNAETAALLRALGVTGRITADSAEPKSVQDYRRAGLRCHAAVKGPGSVEYSCKWLQSLEKIVIDPTRCPDTWREFSGYEYARGAQGELLEGYPDRENHHIDAVRYALEPVWRRAR